MFHFHHLKRIYAPRSSLLQRRIYFYGHGEEALSAGFDQGCDATLKKARSMLRLMAEAADTPQELLPGMPLIEITGAGRVLIENHGGVTEYETDRIRVRLRFGAVVIRGNRLKITRMSKCQLVISGSLAGVDLERGSGC